MELSALVAFVVGILIVGAVFWLLWWLVNLVPSEPFRTVGRIVVGIVAALYLIGVLLGTVHLPTLALLRG